jgi:hypothetical protein
MPTMTIQIGKEKLLHAASEFLNRSLRQVIAWQDRASERESLTQNGLFVEQLLSFL